MDYYKNQGRKRLVYIGIGLTVVGVLLFASIFVHGIPLLDNDPITGALSMAIRSVAGISLALIGSFFLRRKRRE